MKAYLQGFFPLPYPSPFVLKCSKDIVGGQIWQEPIIINHSKNILAVTVLVDLRHANYLNVLASLRQALCISGVTIICNIMFNELICCIVLKCQVIRLLQCSVEVSKIYFITFSSANNVMQITLGYSQLFNTWCKVLVQLVLQNEGSLVFPEFVFFLKTFHYLSQIIPSVLGNIIQHS